MNISSAVLGMHSAFKTRMQQNIVSRVQRHPGIPSSHLGMDLLSGVDDTIEVSDIYGVERPTNPLGRRTVNDALEAMFNISS